ncbi:MAG: inositol monophosphatase family protein [Actinomycetota bacterium]
MSPDPDALRALAVDLAQAAGRLLLQARPTGQISKSSPTDPVTDADRQAESYLVGRLRRERPEDSVIAEEGSLHEGQSGVRWVIDPLDGTVNFVYGIPHWCVSVGVEGAVRLGVVHDPNRRETFTNAGDLRASPKTELAEALVGTGFSYSSAVRDRQGRIARRVLPRVRDIRRAGSLALDLAWLACGRLDGFYEDDIHHWDVSAGIALVESAGGVVALHGSLIVAAGTEELLTKLEALVLGGDSRHREPPSEGLEGALGGA